MCWHMFTVCLLTSVASLYNVLLSTTYRIEALSDPLVPVVNVRRSLVMKSFPRNARPRYILFLHHTYMLINRLHMYPFNVHIC